LRQVTGNQRGGKVEQLAAWLSRHLLFMALADILTETKQSR